jgi:hypothetical protein
MGRGILEGTPRTERIQLETRTTDPTNPSVGEAWLRTDITGTDKVGEFRWFDGQSVNAVDVVTPGTTSSPVEEVLRVQTPNGKGVITTAPRTDATYPEMSLQHAGSPLGLGYSAIPDSEADQKLAHRWVLDDVGSGTATDSAGSADGTVNGVASVSGDWAGSSAGDGDGTDDYIATSPLGTFGSGRNNFAVAFSVQTTTTATVAGERHGGFTDTRLYLDDVFNSTDGAPALALGEDVNERTDAVEIDQTVNDGNPYRVVINVLDASNQSYEGYINQSATGTTMVRTDNVDGSNFTDFQNDFSLFAWNQDGSVNGFIDAIIDDFCLFDEALTQAEAESYVNPWS